MEKKIIKIKYVDQDSTVTVPEDGPFYDLLSKYYTIEMSEDPDYVIYGPFGDEHLKYFRSVKIFYTGECVAPDFNECDYAIGFDYIEFGDRYFRFPLWLKYPVELNQKMEKKHIGVEEDLVDRKFCSYVVSNDYADPFREKLFDSISGYKMTDSGGRYRNNIGCPNGVDDKMRFQSEHKFAIACENASHPGYTTEKLMEAFAAKTVPIYWGDPLVSECFNEKSFINCHSYNSLEDIVNEVSRIDNDREAYLNMLKEPALLDINLGYRKQTELLEGFLKNIFDQDKKFAIRRNLECWGAKYNSNMLERKKYYDRYVKIKKMIKRVLLRR